MITTQRNTTTPDHAHSVSILAGGHPVAVAAIQDGLSSSACHTATPAITEGGTYRGAYLRAMSHARRLARVSTRYGRQP